jgi:hypothetical protein
VNRLNGLNPTQLERTATAHATGSPGSPPGAFGPPAPAGRGADGTVVRSRDAGRRWEALAEQLPSVTCAAVA